jgi:hypothetical protein
MAKPLARLCVGAALDRADDPHGRAIRDLSRHRGARAAILLLTPLSFLFSTARNSREIADIVALVLGLVLYPVAAKMNSGPDILVSGVAAGTIAYGVHFWREARA